MTKSYADECLERAKKATEGPWSTLEEGDEVHAISFVEACGDPLHIALSTHTEYDADFISHARTDVPELARRLKRACETLRGYDIHLFNQILDELEAPLEKKK